jgi:hypothetical protein
MEKYLKVITDGYTGYANYFFNEILNPGWHNYFYWLSWDGQKLTRSIPDITLKKTKEFKGEDIELMKQGKYTSISRFERQVEKFDNTAAALSTNKMAVMIKTNPYALTQNSDILENIIYLSPIKN